MTQGNLGGTFDANTVAPQETFDPIPTGWYKAMVTDSALKNTKAGTGQYLKLEWQVLEGEHQGRKVFDNINLANPNPKASEIGQRQLSAVCHATGTLQISDSSQLHNLPCLIRVKATPPTAEYDAGNEVKGYRHVTNPPRTMQSASGGAGPAPAPQAPAPAPPATAPAPAPQPPVAPAAPVTSPAPQAQTAAPGKPVWMQQ